MLTSLQKILFLFILILLATNSFAQTNAGTILSYKKINVGIEGKTINCIFDVHVYNDDNGTENNSFVYYEHAGNGFGYKHDEYCKRIISFNASNKKLPSQNRKAHSIQPLKK